MILPEIVQIIAQGEWLKTGFILLIY